MTIKAIKNFLNIIRGNLRNSRTLYQKTIRANSRHLRTFFFLFLFAVSCSKQPTSPETGSLTGTVLLEGQTNHSGITVALYKLAELDTTILRYNREYPNVGFPISQATEFACPPGVWRNHRFAEVVAETKTKADGTFKIEGIEERNCNLVAKKEGFGWKYIYYISITKGSNTSITQFLNNSVNKSLNNRMNNFPNYTTNLNHLFSRQARQSHTFLFFTLLNIS